MIDPDITYDKLRTRIERAEKELREAQEELKRLEEGPVWVPPKGTIVEVSDDLDDNWIIRRFESLLENGFVSANNGKGFASLSWNYWRFPEIHLIPWHGGENPAPGKKVLYRRRSSLTFFVDRSDNLFWHHHVPGSSGAGNDIVEFLVISSDRS